MSRKLRKLRTNARKNKTKPTLTLYRKARGRIRRVGEDRYCEAFTPNKHAGTVGLIGNAIVLKRDVKFPDYDTAVSYAVTRKLGYEITKPAYGHWINPNYWTPLCITQYKQGTDALELVVTALEFEDG